MLDSHDKTAKEVWLIDRRSYWRRFCRQALESAGFRVRAWERYTFPPAGEPPDGRPDLVILACTLVGSDEIHLAESILRHNHTLLVLPASVSTRVMRTLFLAGAHDVAEMPGHADSLVSLVSRSIEESERADSYQTLLRAKA